MRNPKPQTCQILFQDKECHVLFKMSGQWKLNDKYFWSYESFYVVNPSFSGTKIWVPSPYNNAYNIWGTAQKHIKPSLICQQVIMLHEKQQNSTLFAIKALGEGKIVNFLKIFHVWNLYKYYIICHKRHFSWQNFTFHDPITSVYI